MSNDPYANDPVMAELPRPLEARKGRGAVSNLAGRYETRVTEAFDDGWDAEEDADFARGALATQIIEERAKSILTRNASPDIPFNISINPYRGCEHGCIYCFARPTHSYLGLSPGLDFESRIMAKVNAPELLRRELARPSYVPECIALGVNTDAYQPCERRLRLTRRILEILHDCQQPLGLITKSSLIERDIDLLGAMAARNQAIATVTITTLDHRVARTLEPRAAAPARRLQTVRRLAEAGIPVGVNIAPVIPFVTDGELEDIVDAAAGAGAMSMSYIVLRLPWEVNPLFQEWLRTHFPDRAERVMNRIRDLHGGKEYQSKYAQRMRGRGVWAELIRQRFRRALMRSGIAARQARFGGLDASCFRRPLDVPPTPKVDDDGQMDLFG